MRSGACARLWPRAALALVTIVATGSEAAGQAGAGADYPAKPICMIVGFAAGGGNDLVARIVGPKLSENIGQPVVIENKTGAGGRIAVEFAQGQPADGYTLIVGATGQLAVASAIDPNSRSIRPGRSCRSRCSRHIH